jgi:hypothetical protein
MLRNVTPTTTYHNATDRTWCDTEKPSERFKVETLLAPRVRFPNYAHLQRIELRPAVSLSHRHRSIAISVEHILAGRGPVEISERVVERPLRPMTSKHSCGSRPEEGLQNKRCHIRSVPTIPAESNEIVPNARTHADVLAHQSRSFRRLGKSVLRFDGVDVALFVSEVTGPVRNGFHLSQHTDFFYSVQD